MGAVSRYAAHLACACLVLVILAAQYDGSAHHHSLYSGKLAPGRWRGNAYVMDGGLLPYQRCAAGDFAPGPGRVFSGPFLHQNTSYRLAATALSFWGRSSRRGRPTRDPVRAELLVTIAKNGEPCAKAHWHHCATEQIEPPARCRLEGEAGWRPASLGYSKRAIKDLNVDLNRFESIMASTLDCHLGPDFAFRDSFALEFEVGEGSSAAAFAVPACYQHVEAVDDLVLCTQPMYNFSQRSPYFEGTPPYPFGTSLVDAFLLYHTKLQGGKVGVVLQDLDGSFQPALQRYQGGRSGAVRYRPNWELTPGLHSMPGLFPEMEHESFAESTCFWEQRLSARWVMQAVSVDCFLLSRRPGQGAVAALAEVDAAAFAELSVTSTQGFSVQAGGAALLGNVLQRYSLLDKSFETEFWRTMPIFNPRLHTYGVVHWMEYGKRAGVQAAAMAERQVLDTVGLQVLHLMALSGREDKHQGREDAWLAELAEKLSTELERFSLEG
jgi:hypothetical protein